jgi:hypothetical protein
MSEADARAALVQTLWSRCDALFYASPAYKRTWHYAYFVVLGGAVRQFGQAVVSALRLEAMVRMLNRWQEGKRA